MLWDYTQYKCFRFQLHTIDGIQQLYKYFVRWMTRKIIQISCANYTNHNMSIGYVLCNEIVKTVNWKAQNKKQSIKRFSLSHQTNLKSMVYASWLKRVTL